MHYFQKIVCQKCLFSGVLITVFIFPFIFISFQARACPWFLRTALCSPTELFGREGGGIWWNEYGRRVDLEDRGKGDVKSWAGVGEFFFIYVSFILWYGAVCCDLVSFLR